MGKGRTRTRSQEAGGQPNVAGERRSRKIAVENGRGGSKQEVGAAREFIVEIFIVEIEIGRIKSKVLIKRRVYC
jgi:hypothetical protein